MTDNTQSGSDNDVTRKHPSTGVEADKIKDTQELDEILNEVTSFDVYKHPEYVEEAKQAILDWHNKQVLEIIGDDQSQKRPEGGKNTAEWTNGRNNLRQQQRNKLKEMIHG